MGDIQIDELREKLQFSGLDMILSLSLQEQKEDNGKLRRARVNDYIDVFNLEMSIDNPDVGWSKRIGKFYENKRGYDNSSWRVGELNKVLGQDPVSYFMYDKPEFELCDEDKLTLVKSMVTKIDMITDAGIRVCGIGMNRYDEGVMRKAAELIKKVPYESYVIGRDHVILV